MFFIPGWLISLATFPGVIVHEFAHMLFCKIRGVAVLDVCFFRLENPAGYVLHESVEDFNSVFLISIGPFIVNSLLCMIICFPAFIPVRIFGVGDPLSYLLLWLGLSIGMHAFPSTQDASLIFEKAKENLAAFNVLAIISFPLVALIYVFNFLRFFWVDLLYGFAIGLLLPELLLQY